MSNVERSTKIRVIRPDDVIWEEAMTYPEETDPPGDEFTAAQSSDQRFSCGLWQRKTQGRYFERPYHEIAYIIEGEVEITDGDGDLHKAVPGDILVTPKGSKGYWKNSHRSRSSTRSTRIRATRSRPTSGRDLLASET